MRLLNLLLAATLAVSAVAQTPLPNQMTADEVHMIEDYNSGRTPSGIITPPTSPVRTMAEWEEIQSLVITWAAFSGILSDIADFAQEQCQVIIICTDSNSVKSTLTSNGVPLTNISYIEDDYDSIWMRDYGGNTVYKNDVDSVYLVDWIYNRPRPDDDAVPTAVSNFKNIPLYEMTTPPYSLVHTGGNFMADGFGTAFSSVLVLEENDPSGVFNPEDLTEAQIDARMGQFMGISTYIKMQTLPYDGIHHIDMHMKLLDEETLLVSEYPFGVADGPQIETNLDYVLNNFNSVYGTPYEVVRIPAPPSTSGLYPDAGGYYRTYTNQVFVNDVIIVPTYRAEYDTIAMRILKDAMPGYEIKGIDCDTPPNNIISQSGAIHCITRAIGVDEPLLISHQRLRDTSDDTNPYTVTAYIKHISGIANATLYWTTDTLAGYSPVAMSNVSADDWEAQIPAQPVGSKIFYYIHAEANSGKQQVRPIVAPSGYWMFRVLGPVGINDPDEAGIVMDEIFPNPTNDIACVPVNSNVSVEGRIDVIDVLGRNVQEVYTGTIPAGLSRYYIQSEILSPGSYSVRVVVGESTYTKQLIVK